MSTRKPPFQGAVADEHLARTVGEYAASFEGDPASRTSSASSLTKSYYQLVTDFYEYGWGQSFHFAPRNSGESVGASLVRHEKWLARALGIQRGMRVLDVGCGVGGPMRTIASETGANITGITIAPYQIERGRSHNARAGLANLCELVEADFSAMPFDSASFDAAYTIEACCHAEDRRLPFREVFRTLKPGGVFAGWDWGMTPLFRADDARHAEIKLRIEKGNGIARLLPTHAIDVALAEAGFHVVDTQDFARAADPETPWYEPLASGVSLRGFRNSRLGAFLTHQLVRVLEFLRLCPRGTLAVHDVLRIAQQGLVEGGRAGIFTPLYFWIARKPAE